MIIEEGTKPGYPLYLFVGLKAAKKDAAAIPCARQKPYLCTMGLYKIIALALIFIVSIFVVLKAKKKTTYLYFMFLGLVVMALAYTSPNGTTQVYAVGTILGLYLIVKNFFLYKKHKDE